MAIARRWLTQWPHRSGIVCSRSSPGRSRASGPRSKCEGFGVISDTQTGVPWHLDLRTKGKAAAVHYFEALASSVDHKAFEQRDFAATGDHVYATVRLVQAIHATGKTLEQPEVILHFTFRSGKVVRCRVSEDTALTKAAFVK